MANMYSRRQRYEISDEKQDAQNIGCKRLNGSRKHDVTFSHYVGTGRVSQFPGQSFYYPCSNLKVTIRSFRNATNLHYYRIPKNPDAAGTSFSVGITLGASSTVGLLLSAMFSSNLFLEPSPSL